MRTHFGPADWLTRHARAAGANLLILSEDHLFFSASIVQRAPQLHPGSIAGTKLITQAYTGCSFKSARPSSARQNQLRTGLKQRLVP